MNLEQTIEVLKKAINEYMALVKNQSQDINALLDLRDRIAGYSFYFAEICGDLKIQYNYQHFIRKIMVAKDKQAFLKEGKTLWGSDNEALIKNEEAYNAQLESEGDAYKADLLLKQTNRVLDGIAQRISYLKIEKFETKNQQ